MRLFHVHIPKTAGTSFNAMLRQAFGSRFGEHCLTDAGQGYTYNQFKWYAIAAHRPAPEAARLFPGYRQVTILREPEARLRSELRHHYARRTSPKYAHTAPAVTALAEGDLSALDDPALMVQTDNVLVRYLSDVPAGARVGCAHLAEAVENLGKVQHVLMSETFTEDATRLFAGWGLALPEIETLNRSKASPRAFATLPPECERLVRYDRALYDIAMGRRLR